MCRVSDASGELEITEVGRYPLKVELLDSKVLLTLLACAWSMCEEFFCQDAFIVDTGRGGIFAWLGKEATKQEKKAAFKNAVVCLPLRWFINVVPYNKLLRMIIIIFVGVYSDQGLSLLDQCYLCA